MRYKTQMYTFLGSEYEPSIIWRGLMTLIDAARTFTS